MISGNHESGFRGVHQQGFPAGGEDGAAGNSQGGGSKMVVYEFYRRVPGGEDRLIGVLPERRKDEERITHQSIMNWARLLVPEQIFNDKVYFVRVEGK
jgi:hypothetical protein